MSRRNCLMMQVIVHFCQIRSSLVHKKEKFLMTLEIVHIRHTHTTRDAMPEICILQLHRSFSWRIWLLPMRPNQMQCQGNQMRFWQSNSGKLFSHFSCLSAETCFCVTYLSYIKWSSYDWLIHNTVWYPQKNLQNIVE